MPYRKFIASLTGPRLVAAGTALTVSRILNIYCVYLACWSSLMRPMLFFASEGHRVTVTCRRIFVMPWAHSCIARASPATSSCLCSPVMSLRFVFHVSLLSSKVSLDSSFIGVYFISAWFHACCMWFYASITLCIFQPCLQVFNFIHVAILPIFMSTNT